VGDANDNFVKACLNLGAGSLGVGQACGNGDAGLCRSGMCLAAGNLCTDTCCTDADCPDGWLCAYTANGRDNNNDGNQGLITICVPSG